MLQVIFATKAKQYTASEILSTIVLKYTKQIIPCLTFLCLNQKEDYGQNNLGSFCSTGFKLKVGLFWQK